MGDSKRDEQQSTNAIGGESCRHGTKPKHEHAHPEPGLRDLIDFELAGHREEDTVNTSQETKLSALIKRSQLLVAERALLTVELDEADFAAQALEACRVDS